MKATALIFGTPAQEQTIKFEFEFIPVRKWFGERSTFFVNYIKIKDSLNFRPSDLKTDLEYAIAQALGEDETDIRIECEIEHRVVIPILATENVEYQNMLFI
jgi:hypothetical protein